MNVFKWTKSRLFFFNSFDKVNIGSYLCLYQAKWKQALLESNLPGIHLMTDEKVKRKEFV